MRTRATIVGVSAVVAIVACNAPKPPPVPVEPDPLPRPDGTEPPRLDVSVVPNTPPAPTTPALVPRAHWLVDDPADDDAPRLFITHFGRGLTLHRGEVGNFLLGALAESYRCYREETPGIPVPITLGLAWDEAAQLTESEVRSAMPPELAQCIRTRVGSLPNDPKLAAQSAYVSAWVAMGDDARKLFRQPTDEFPIERTHGMCWQQEDYPCAPHKMCQASEMIRVVCPSD